MLFWFHCPPVALLSSLPFVHANTYSGQREFYHFTSYAMTAGIPMSFLLGGPVSTVVDLAMGVLIPLHAHIGMRSVLVDYLHEESTREAVIMGLTVLTVGSAAGLTFFNINDVGLTEGVKALFVKQQLA